MEIDNSSNYRQTGGGSMIVNIQDFYSFLKKISSGLGSFDEVISPYRTSPEKNNNPSFGFGKLDETENRKPSNYRAFQPLKILFYLSREKVYPLKIYTSKNQITQLLIFSCVLINIYQIDFVNII
jgi:hypothetical protein